MREVLNYFDLPILRDAGFKASEFSGSSWYGHDLDGNLWQAYEDEMTGQLLFHTFPKSALCWTPATSMTREFFDELFKGEHNVLAPQK